jgi:hypothetical protein
MTAEKRALGDDWMTSKVVMEGRDGGVKRGVCVGMHEGNNKFRRGQRADVCPLLCGPAGLQHALNGLGSPYTRCWDSRKHLSSIALHNPRTHAYRV